MPEVSSLLFPIFNWLRKQGVPLGISDYLLAINMLRSGNGIKDFLDFKNLCNLLWTKSKEDQELLDIAFAQFLPNFQLITTPAHVTTPAKALQEVSELPTVTNDQSSVSKIPNGVQVFTGQDFSKNEAQNLPHNQVLLVREQEEQYKTGISGFRLAQDLERFHRYNMAIRLPVNKREMATAWRQLRKPMRVGIPEDLDVDSTVRSICETGIFLGPKLQPRRRNLVKLFVLVDRKGSMAPFNLIINALAEGIGRGGLLGRVQFYYFHNCPDRLLYVYPDLTKPISLERILDSEIKGNSVLIVSDAGAARRYYYGKRLATTKAFLNKLKISTYLYAWLNPLPKDRWINTTAEDIAKLMPMFSIDREGLHDAVSVLRGHPFISEI